MPAFSSKSRRIYSRRLSWAAAIAIILLCLVGPAGCSPHRKRTDKVHLVMTVPADRLTRPVYERTVRDFEARHPNIEVELIAIPRDYYRKVLVMIAGRNAPDLTDVPGQNKAVMVRKSIIYQDLRRS